MLEQYVFRMADVASHVTIVPANEASGRTAWAGRKEDKNDDGVGAVACFVTRPGFRRRGVRPRARARRQARQPHGSRRPFRD
jgi:hypothetical protein